VSVTKFALARRCLSAAEMGNAENSFKIIPMLPVFWRPGVLFISARLRPSGDTKSKARLAVCADTKSIVGCGLQAAGTGINDCISQYEVVALQRGCGFFARHRPYTAPCQGSACFLPSPRISVATALKGLGSIRPGFLHADKRKGRGPVLAGCLACEARKAGNQTIKRIVRIT
jgi:hypothetical protein